MMSHWTLSRRDLLKVSALGAGSVLLPLARLGTGVADVSTTSPSINLFEMALPIPVAPDALAKPTGGQVTVQTPLGPRTADTFLLEAKGADVQILPPSKFPKTRVWGYNGLYPGPTFVLKRDQAVVVTHRNLLTPDRNGRDGLGLAAHFHGGNVDGFSDGHPTLLVPPTFSKKHTYFNQQPAATMWYHDHAFEHTARNVYNGLAGLYLLHDDNEDGLPLPRNDPQQGRFLDIPLVIQAKYFNADGSLNYPPGDEPALAPNQGILGDVILVNGAAWPHLQVEPRRYRFRFLNGSDAREFLLALSNGQPFLQIATEGGLLPRPIAQKTIHITPAERYEVLIDFAPLAGTNVVLQNLLEDGRLGNIMQFRVGPKVPGFNDPSSVITTTTQLMEPKFLQPRFDALRKLGEAFRTAEQRGGARPSEIAQVRNFRFERKHGGFAINGKFFDLNVDDAAPRVGSYEVWNLENDSGGWFHPVHLHLLHAGFGFVVIDRNGVPITPTDQEWGWKETVNVGRNNESVRVIMHWPEVPVNPDNVNQPRLGTPPQRRVDFFERRYVFHCHNIEHEDHDMMAQVRIDH